MPGCDDRCDIHGAQPVDSASSRSSARHVRRWSSPAGERAESSTRASARPRPVDTCAQSAAAPWMSTGVSIARRRPSASRLCKSPALSCLSPATGSSDTAESVCVSTPRQPPCPNDCPARRPDPDRRRRDAAGAPGRRRAAHGRAVPRPGVDRVDDRAGAVRRERTPRSTGCASCRPGGPTGRSGASPSSSRGGTPAPISLRDEGPGRAEIAYGSHPDVRGTGAMLRALRLLVDWGFAELDLETIVWQAFTGNWPSRKLAWRLGVHGRGHPAPLPPPARRAARRVDRHAAQGRPARAAVDLARRARCSRATASGCDRSRDDDAPRIHEGTARAGQPSTGSAHKPAPYTLDRRAARTSSRRRELAGHRAVRHLGDRRPATTTGSSARCCGSTGRRRSSARSASGPTRTRAAAVSPPRRPRLAVGHVFETLGVKRVTAYAAVDNTASRRVRARPSASVSTA